MTTHYLKCWPIFFFEVASGMKTFEIRKNDRDFRVGDIIVLQYWDPLTKDYNKAYSDRRFKVIYILDQHEGLLDGYVILQLKIYDPLI